MQKKFPDLDLILIESGGDNLAATFSPELADMTIYVIDVSAGDKIPRKGGPGITKSDLLVINKIDLAPYIWKRWFHPLSNHQGNFLVVFLENYLRQIPVYIQFYWEEFFPDVEKKNKFFRFCSEPVQILQKENGESN